MFPVFIVVIIFLIKIFNPVIAVAEAIIGVVGSYMGVKQMIAQYKVLKHHNERMKKRKKKY